MLIDWFTIAAQAINFLVLVWLMKRYLYRPILRAIDSREQLIAGKLADADTKKAEAQKEREGFEHKNQLFDRQHAAMVSKATDEAKAEAQRILDEARKAADALSARRAETLVQEAHSLNKILVGRVQQEVFAIARKALTDLAGASLEERLGTVFIGRLDALDAKAKAALAAALKASAEPARVRSAFELPAAQRTAIQKALAGLSDARVQVQFETSPDLISGIELTTNGSKLSWSIADYLTSLSRGVDDLLEKQDQPEPQPKAKTQKKAKATGTITTKPSITRRPKSQSKSKSKSKPEVAESAAKAQ
jgi:F-type H+-transporting ATPase subunit b